MKEENRNLYYLNDLSDYKVAKDYIDVRTWDVVDADNRTIGKVDGLLVNKEEERVVYLDVEVDNDLIEAGHETYATPANKGIHEFLNQDGENHIIIPIGTVSLDEDNKIVHCNHINYTTFSKTKRFRKGFDLDRSFEQVVLPHYFPGYIAPENIGLQNQYYNRKEFDPLF
jgi:hypothetical protein